MARESLRQTLEGLSTEDRDFVRQLLADGEPSEATACSSNNQSQPFIRKLRLFSGKKPVPNGEVDFETWSRLAQQVVNDTEVSESSKQRVVLSSLLRPALDIALSETTSKGTLDTLRTIYGNVQDGINRPSRSLEEVRTCRY